MTEQEVNNTGNESNEQLQQTEERAKTMGWTPQDQFKGDPARWIPAEAYVKRAEEEMPILRGTLKKLEGSVGEQSRIIKEQAAENKRLNEKLETMSQDVSLMVESGRKAEQRAYDRALKDLQAQQRAAVETQDTATFDKVTADINEHIKQHPAVTGKPADIPVKKDETKPAGATDIAWKPDAVVFDNWVAENTWYQKDPELAVYAHQIDAWLTNNRKFSSQQSQLDEVTKHVKEKFPEHFGQAKKQTAPTVEGSGDAGPVGGNSSKKNYGDLPAWAKEVCDRQAGKDGLGKSGSIPGFKRDDYIRDFDWAAVK